MKNPPPTLADVCAKMMLDKRRAGKPDMANAHFRELLRNIVAARKFTLDKNMSRFLADLTTNFWKGKLARRNRAVDTARQLARLPHAMTWIEFEFADYLARMKELGRNVIIMSDTDRQPEKLGWLIRQHPKLDTGFICSEVRSTLLPSWQGAFVHPISYAWSSTDDPIPFQQFELYDNSDMTNSEIATMLPGYRSPHVFFTATFARWVSEKLLRAIVGRGLDGKLRDGDRIGMTTIWQAARPTIAISDSWALLATINELPVVIEHVEPSKGFIARGSYKKFLKHSIIHLTVPETRWRKLALKTAAALRRRAHQVRGHWRKDWRNPLTPLCDHQFNSEMICARCKGHKIWIGEHQRGDASIGFVTHDYSVERDTERTTTT